MTIQKENKILLKRYHDKNESVRQFNTEEYLKN